MTTPSIVFPDPVHGARHEAGQPDALSWTTVHGAGPLGSRPPADATNAGYLYYQTDGTQGIYRSNGAAWELWAGGGSGGIANAMIRLAGIHEWSTTDSPFTLLTSTINHVNDTAGDVIANLPPTANQGDWVVVEKTGGSAIAPGNKVSTVGNMRGVSGVTINQSLYRQSDTYWFQATNGVSGAGTWYPQQGRYALGTLDSRFAPMNPTAPGSIDAGASATVVPAPSAGGGWDRPYRLTAPVCPFSFPTGVVDSGGLPAVVEVTLYLTQDATGGRDFSITNSGVTYTASGNKPVPDPTPGALLVETYISLDGGAHYLGQGAPASALSAPMFPTNGNLSVKTGGIKYQAPEAMTILDVVANVGTAPTGSSIIVDVRKNGTSIYTTTGRRPTIAAGTTAATTSGPPNVTALAAGDLLTVDVVQIGSGTAGADLSVQPLLQRFG